MRALEYMMTEESKKINRLELEIAELKIQLENLKSSCVAKTDLVAPNFITRAFAVLGHSLVAQFLVCIPVGFIALILFFVGGFN